MKNIIIIRPLGLGLCACGPSNTIKQSGTAYSSTTPKTASNQPVSVNKNNIIYAEQLGAALHKAMQSHDSTDPYVSREARLITLFQ